MESAMYLPESEPMPNPSPDIELARLLAARLERLSADSLWARRASGARGALLKILDQYDKGEISAADWQRLDQILNWGFYLLEKAAKELT
jgi:hypothetical protein